MRNPNVTFIYDEYDDIVHVLQQLHFNLGGSLQKFYHGNIRLTVEFENNTQYNIVIFSTSYATAYV